MRFIYIDSGTIVFPDRNHCYPIEYLLVTFQTNRIIALLFKISIKIIITSSLLGIW